MAESSLNLRPLTAFVLAVLCVSPQPARRAVRNMQGAGQLTPASKSATAQHSECQNSQEKKRITITCEYTKTIISSRQAVPPVALNHASLSFATNEDNYMEVKLVFTNLGTEPISEKRDVYLEIDDAGGGNYIRRLLPAVDFRELVPGRPLEFSLRLLTGAYMANHYYIYLWIPSPDPSLKFKPANNFLISSAGVPNPATGLNKVAEFSVEREVRPK